MDDEPKMYVVYNPMTGQYAGMGFDVVAKQILREAGEGYEIYLMTEVTLLMDD